MRTTYRVKVLKVVRGAGNSYYIPVPRDLAEKTGMGKGHVLDWTFKTRDILQLKHLGLESAVDCKVPCKRKKKR